MNHPATSHDRERFQPTRWSLVLRARGEGSAARRALGELCQAYWFPLYSWCRRGGLSPQDAEDMVQGFFLSVLEKQLFDLADASRGKLRTFLLTALKRHVRDEREKHHAIKRGGGKVVSFDALEAEQWYAVSHIDGETPEHEFDRRWALTVLENTVQRLQRESAGKGRGDSFAAMRPFLTAEGDADAYQAAAAPLGMSANTFKVAVHRLRGKFRDALRAEVAETQPDGADVDEEIRHLMQALGSC
jgi:RNA polymerase sigma-70 factor (ECF subfamily)